MSLSEPQYYEAKVFLKALIDAHATLEDAAKQQAQLDKLKYYQSAVVSAASQGHIKIQENHLIKGTGFESSKIFKTSSFVKQFLAKRLAPVQKAATVGELTAAFQSVLK